MFEGAGQMDNAADYYIRASLADPKDTGAYLGAKRTLDQIQDYDRFEQLVRSLEQKRRDIRYRVDLAWIQFKRGDESGARKAWDRLIEENSKNQNVYTLIGQVYLENQFYEEAEDVYLTARKNFKNSTLFMFELANIYKILNQQDKLVDEYLSYLKVHPQQMLFLSTELHRFVQSQDDIGPLIKELKQAKSSNEIAWAIHLFLADSYTITQDYENALLHFIEWEKWLAHSDSELMGQTFQNGQYIHEFASTALNAGATEYAKQAFLFIIEELENDKYRAAAKLGLATAYAQQQNYEQALDALQLFVDSNRGSNDARRALMQIGDIAFTNLFDIERAEKAYSRALKEYPQIRYQIETLFRLADCALAKDDLSAAEANLRQAYAKAAREAELKPACLLQLAYLEFYKKQPKRSLSYLEEFSDVVAPNAQPNVLENDALELSMLLQDNSYDSTGLAILGKATLEIKQRRYKDAKEDMEHYLQENPNSQLRSEVRLLLADVYRQLNDFQPAIYALNSVYADSGSFFRDQALLGVAEIYEKELAEDLLAQEHYEKILLEFPGSIYLEKARERVRKLEEKK
ncbi:tetratricopeptide repeat protein [candidate division KSB1 bacterium]|nr:tetratricopeptide repeat protein [candidate division KSB1 bacterium]